MSAVHHLVLSRTIHAPDRRTDRQTLRQNCDSNRVRCITRSRTVKTAALNSNVTLDFKRYVVVWTKTAHAQCKIAKIDNKKRDPTAKISTSYGKPTSLNLFPAKDLRSK